MTAKNADHAFWFLAFLDRSESADHIMGYCQEHSQPYYTPNTVLCLLYISVCNSRNLSNGSHHIDLSGQAPGQINQSITYVVFVKLSWFLMQTETSLRTRWWIPTSSQCRFLVVSHGCSTSSERWRLSASHIRTNVELSPEEGIRKKMQQERKHASLLT